VRAAFLATLVLFFLDPWFATARVFRVSRY